MRVLTGFIVPAILVGVWEILSRIGFFPSNWLPAPSVVFATALDLARQGELIGHILATVSRVFTGFVIGVAAATVLGSLTGCSRWFRDLVDPLLQALRNIPSMAWVPLFLLWLGIEEASKITLIAVGVFFPVYLNLMSGIQNLDVKLIEVGQVFRLKGFQLVRRVILPATLPSYITGLRSGLGLGWMFVVAAELMGASKGLGFLMDDGRMTGRPAIIIVSIILFAIIGKTSDLIVEYSGRWFLKYREA
jgi:sulfonate transport system permease protein